MKNLKVTVFALMTMFAVSSCSEDDAVPVNQEEVLTTISAVFTPVGGGAVVTLTSRDLDGEGPNAPMINVSGSFAANKTYNGEVKILNESVSPAEDMTPEILAEAADHQFFYQTTGNLPAFSYSPMSTTPSNYDANGRPVGNKVVFVTTAASAGTLKVILRHEGDKTKPNVASGDMTNATGSVDIEALFSVTVQ